MSAPLDARLLNPRDGGASFSLRHRLERLAFNFVWWVVETVCPLPIHSVRRRVLALFGANIAKTAKIYPGVKIWYPRNLEMASHSCLGSGVICYCMAPISIGLYALVSQRAHLCAGTHAIDDPNFQLRVKPIVVRSHAWVAAEAFVGPGVTIGEGAVLGARGVAFGDLKPWSVNVGNPARLVRMRRAKTLKISE